MCGHRHEVCLILVSIEEKSCCVSQVKGQTNATRPGRPDLKVEGGFLWKFPGGQTCLLFFFSEDAFFRKCVWIVFFAFVFFFGGGSEKNGSSDWQKAETSVSQF